MTTIVCSKDCMAADSLADDGGIRTKCIKLFKVDGAIIGISGSLSEGVRFVDWFKEQASPPPDIGESCMMILYSDGRRETWDSTGYPLPIFDKFYAIGSGAEAALGAMYAGATPEEAVKIACKVDMGTGLPVKMYVR